MAEVGSKSCSSQDYVDADEGFSSTDSDIEETTVENDPSLALPFSQDGVCNSASTSTQDKTNLCLNHGGGSQSLRRRVLKSLGKDNSFANSVDSEGSRMEISNYRQSRNFIESSSEIVECSVRTDRSMGCDVEDQVSDGNNKIMRNKLEEQGSAVWPSGYEPDIEEEDGEDDQEISAQIVNGPEYTPSLSRFLSSSDGDGIGSSSYGITDCIPAQVPEVACRTPPANRVVTVEHSTREDVNSSSSRDQSQKSILFWVAGLVIQATGFQLGIMLHILSVPMWLMRQGYYVATEPLQTISVVKDKVKENLSRMCYPVSHGINTMLQGPSQVQPSIGKVARKFGWGCFWSSYVCFVLCLLLAMAFTLGYLVMQNFVEEPIQMKEPLHFDYTKPHPVALVPLQSCYRITSLDTSANFRDEKKPGPRLIPAHHKLQVTIALTLPESDYNRKLGIFQVRVEFLSAEGKVIASSSHPCMLRFKSLPIRYAETFLMTAPLLAGYTSESQTLSVRMMEFTEKIIPTACLRVSLERRAEFRPGTGIPEIYSAELCVDSELPWQKKVIWNWKWTLFIWVGMGFYAMEVLVMLCCCKPIIFPKVRSREVVSDEHGGNQRRSLGMNRGETERPALEDSRTENHVKAEKS